MKNYDMKVQFTHRQEKRAPYPIFGRTKRAILFSLTSIERKVNRLMLDMTALTDAVGDQTDVISSVSLLLDRLAAELEAAQGDPAVLAEAVATIRANSARLASSVVMNTDHSDEEQPVPQPEPSVEEEPVPSEPTPAPDVQPPGPSVEEETEPPVTEEGSAGRSSR